MNLDQFYTKPALARILVHDLLKNGLFFENPPQKSLNNALFFEPAAGAGAFVRPLKHAGQSVIAYDIAPAARGIKKGDFLSEDLMPIHPNLIVIGNPPFGKAAHKAVRFFNQAAVRASVIAFIVPRTFQKVSVHNRLRRFFWLEEERLLQKNAFLVDGSPHDVPCCWQVWRKKGSLRPLFKAPDVSYWFEYTSPEYADFVVRRVGGRAGDVMSLSANLSLTTNYFIKTSYPREVAKIFASIDWESTRSATVGVRSISKLEIALKFSDLVDGMRWQIGREV